MIMITLIVRCDKICLSNERWINDYQFVYVYIYLASYMYNIDLLLSLNKDKIEGERV